MRTPTGILTDAVNILNADGWTVGDFKCEEGKRCAVGALRAAAFGSEYPRDKATKGFSVGNGRAYRNALRALAQTINPKVVKSLVAARQRREETTALGLGYTRPWSASDEVEILETEVINYNDSRAETAAGRNAVLRRFTKAAETVSA